MLGDLLQMEVNNSPGENATPTQETRAPNFRSVDWKGERIVDWSSSGRWKATSFIFVYEAWEKMAWLMMASSLVHYLQSDLKESSKIAVRSVHNLIAVSHITSIFGGVLADGCLGSFRTILIFSGISTVGSLMLTMSAFIPSLNPYLCSESVCSSPKTFDVAFLYVTFSVLTVGKGGVWPALPAFGADQFSDRIPAELISRNSFFNWFFFSGAVGSLFTWTFLVYAENHLKQEWQFGFPTIATFMALIFFLFGTSFYRYKQIQGQPLKRLAQVIVAAVRNRKAVLPADDSRLYEEREICNHRLAWNEKSASPMQSGSRKLCHTAGFRCLDKAAMIGTMRVVDGAARIPSSRWKLCPVTQVEDLKLVLRIAPIWLTTLMFNVVKAQVPILFVEQGEAMDRKVGAISISSASMQAVTSVVLVLAIPGYDLIIVPWVRGFTKDQRGFPLLQRIGIGLVFSILSMIAAALTEIERRKHNNLSILWLCPQYIMQGFGDVFTSVGQLEYFYDQAPDSMRGMAAGLYFTNYGVAMFLGNLFSTIVNVLSRRQDRRGWVTASDINRGRLDLYFWSLAVLGSMNFLVFLALTRSHKYKKVDTRVITIDSRSFEWNMSELGLMQKPALFKHMSNLKAVKEEEHVPDESSRRSSYHTTPEWASIPSRHDSPL